MRSLATLLCSGPSCACAPSCRHTAQANRTESKHAHQATMCSSHLLLTSTQYTAHVPQLSCLGRSHILVIASSEAVRANQQGLIIGLIIIIMFWCMATFDCQQAQHSGQATIRHAANYTAFSKQYAVNAYVIRTCVFSSLCLVLVQKRYDRVKVPALGLLTSCLVLDSKHSAWQ